jgi:endonuclease/exonuclease/phosphatase family metal-dependent hydrolase
MNISILNLNMMHGRNTKTPVWPVFVPKEKVMANIHQIAELIKQYNPDIVTLQEVDKNSVSNGKVDELKELNAILGYPYTAYGNHFHTPFATFGTAILSKFPLHNTKSHRFPIAFPTPRKGYLLTEVEVSPGRRVLLSSVHTTWINILYPDTRTLQLQHILKNVLQRHAMPIIMSGDFNDTIHDNPNRRVEDFMDRLSLCTYKPLSHELSTFPSDNPKNRIDWIMVSHDFEFETYESHHVLLSDHLPIYAKIILKGE